MTTIETTIEGLQAKVAEMSNHLRYQGLIPPEAEVRRKVLSIEARRERIAAVDASEKAWRDETARIQTRTAAAQKKYDDARQRVNEANAQIETLRAEQVRLTADHVEKRDAAWKELYEGRTEAIQAACNTLDAENERCFIQVPRGVGRYPAEASRDARLEALRLLRQEIETSWSRLEDTDAELVARFNAELAKIPAIKAAA